jgi:hypothetical protein
MAQPGDPIEVRCGKGTRRDPHAWREALVTRLTPTRLLYRWPADPQGTERGPARLDCEGKTWRRA